MQIKSTIACSAVFHVLLTEVYMEWLKINSTLNVIEEVIVVVTVDIHMTRLFIFTLLNMHSSMVAYPSRVEVKLKSSPTSCHINSLCMETNEVLLRSLTSHG